MIFVDPWTAFALGLAIGIVLAVVVGAILWWALAPALDYEALLRQHRLEQKAEMWRTMALMDYEVHDVPEMFSTKVPDLRLVK